MMRRFHSRRVYVLHGVLLIAVLVVVYFSARAQYSALVDQRLEETRSQQQVSVRSAALLIEQTFRALTTPTQNVSESRAVPIRPTTVALVDRSTGRVAMQEQAEAATPDDAVAALITRYPYLLRTESTQCLVIGDPPDKTIALVTPAEDAQRIRVQLIPAGQIPLALQSGLPQSPNIRTIFGSADGTVLASGAGPVKEQTLDELVPDPGAVRDLYQSIAADSVGDWVGELPAPYGLSVLTIDPITPAPGVRWFVLVWRRNQREQIGQTLQPLVWQLASGAGMVVAAVAIVLASTTISLFAGRRRIEQMRLAMLNRDLQKARRIQLNWLPASHEQTGSYAIAAENLPAAHISGDFYNWFDLAPQGDEIVPRTVVVLGDVSGHGLPAAFLMATTQLLVKNAMPRLRDPGACLTEVNQQICSLVFGGQFVTMLILVIDHAHGMLEIASAGQAPPLLRRGTNVEELPVDPQLVVGVDDTMAYDTHRIRVHPNDLLLLYTDGIVETMDHAGKQLGLKGLCEALRDAPDEPAHVIHSLVGAIAAHRQGEDPEDDLTLVALRLLPLTPASSESASEAAMV